jgi:hypothetical protein
MSNCLRVKIFLKEGGRKKRDYGGESLFFLFIYINELENGKLKF